MTKGGGLKSGYSAAHCWASAVLNVLKRPRFISFQVLVVPAAPYVNIETKIPVYP